MLFALVAKLFGEKAIHNSYAVLSVQTVTALSLCGYRYREAAIMLLGSDDDSRGQLTRKVTSLRQQVQRIKSRVQSVLRETSFAIPVRPSIEQNMETWDPTVNEMAASEGDKF